MNSQPEPILVDTEVAAHYIGRSAWTIYRWASEGRITRHGGRGRRNALWDLRELPPWSEESGLPKPPPPKIKNFQNTT